QVKQSSRRRSSWSLSQSLQGAWFDDPAERAGKGGQDDQVKIRSKEKLVVSRATGGWSVSGGTFALGLLLCALCLPVAAQEPKKVPRIGFLSGGSPSSFSRFTEAFREGLRELGYVEEKNIAIEYKWAEGTNDRLPNLAAELVRLKVDVIVTSGGTTTIFAAKNATERIPIV